MGSARSRVSVRDAFPAPAPRAASCSQSAPHRLWRTKRSGSSSSTGGSSSASARSRWTGRRGRRGRPSMPRARSSSSPPDAPKRASTADRSSAANCPMLPRPKSRKRSRVSASAGSRLMESGASQAASASRFPIGIAVNCGGAPLPAALPLPTALPLPADAALPAPPTTAATCAPKRVLPIPMRGAPGSSSATDATTRSTSTGSAPHSRASPSMPRNTCPNAARRGSVSPSMAGVKSLSTRSAASNASR